jgi:hypothetical protein
VGDISLMVFPASGTAPSGPDSRPPQFLVHQKGLWRSAKGVPSAPQPLSDVRKNLDKDLLDLMREVGATTDPQPVWSWLRTKCIALRQSIMPTDVERLLQDAAGSEAGGSQNPSVLRIYVHPQLEWIPWEILHDGTDYLGLRFQMTRLPIVSDGPDPDDLPHPVALVYNLLGENVVDKTDPLFTTWQSTFHGLIQAAQEMQRPSTDDWPLLAQFDEATSQPVDILHVTCHGGLTDNSGQSYWTLNEKKDIRWQHRIYADALVGRKLTNKPLVFGNACASSQAAPSSESSITYAPSLGTRFFDHGAVAFVGTFAPISNRLAFDFALHFYRKLLQDGLPVAKALWATKYEYRTNQENDPSWLFYCLFGPAETRFQP